VRDGLRTSAISNEAQGSAAPPTRHSLYRFASSEADPMWGDTTSPACRDATRTPLVQVARRNRSRRRSCACPELAPGGPAFRKEPKLVPPAPRAAPVIWVPFEGSASRRLVAGRRRSVVRTARSRARAQAFSNADLEPWASWQGAIECASPLASMSHTCRSGGAAGRPTSRPK
jgi:hypothetical protein